MAVLDSTEIVLAGVKHLEDWLKGNGYTSIAIDIWQPGSADIQANGKGEKILLQARTALHPAAKTLLNGTDKYALKEMAVRLKSIAYVAYLTIDQDKELIGEIIWERLS
jgi:hypothetical protein